MTYLFAGTSKFLKLGLGLFCLSLFLVGAENLTAADNLISSMNDGKLTVWGGDSPLANVNKDGVLLIDSETGTDSSWSFAIAVDPSAEYKLTGQIKTENVVPTTGAGALFNVHEIQTLRSKALKGNNDWTNVELTFQTEGQKTLTVNALLGGWGLAKGKAYYRNMSLELVKKIAPPSPIPEGWSPNIVIDANKKGDAISPYIYGQFIEHLGRCIYGGIWAEMLQDRKFHDPIGRRSAWQPIYDCKIEMDKNDPFVGEWTPKASVEVNPDWMGVAQKGLVLEKGRKYNGYAWVKPGDGIEKVEIHLHWSEKHEEFSAFSFDVPKNEYTKIEFELESPVDFDNTEIEVAAFGKGTFSVGCVSMMPSDNISGMRADTLAALKELNSPIYRWPGGNFVSGYNWQDGIGDRDRRPPRRNPAWSGIEHNDFGLDEFMVFCKYLGTEPYIAVNTGNGKVDNALLELEYANSSAETPMGKKRAENGHTEPYSVKWWGIGNEMFGSWQIGHMPTADYVKKHNEFVDAFRAKDKNIVVIGVGNVGEHWNPVFIPGAFDHLDYISEHFYVQERENLQQHINLVPDAIKGITGIYRGYEKKWPELYAKRKLRVAMDEWNYWYGPTPFGELGTRYFVKDGLGIAAGLHEFYRQSDVYFMANYAQTVNVIGAIKTSKTNVQFETTGLVLKLYRAQYGTTPLDVQVLSDAKIKASSPLRILDTAAALSEDGKFLTIGLVNETLQEITANVDLKGVQVESKGTKFVIADPENDPNAYNDPDVEQRIDIAESPFEFVDGKITVAPLSVTLIKLPVKK